MGILRLQDVVKQYRNHTAVNAVSFEVPKGSIFGLLGPNGAGKTSIIRIITSITVADKGTVFFDEEKFKQVHVNQIGYLPEERGLYKKMKVGEQLLYLSQLRGMSSKEAKNAVNHWLEKFDIQDWWNKKIEELSKGMQQKIQFIAAVIHEPKLLILDEPFTGLDPLNTNLIKEEIYRLNDAGTSIIFSTHRMEQVEEICKDIVLINNGQVILNGEVNNIKKQYQSNKFRFEFNGSLPDNIDQSSFDIIEDTDEYLRIQLHEGKSINPILQGLIHADKHIQAFREELPTLNEIFIQTVNNQ